MKKLTIDEVKMRLPSFIKIDEATYINASKKARFIDSQYGEWWARPSGVFFGYLHPKRGYAIQSKNRSWSIEEIKQLLPEHLQIDESTYLGVKQKTKFIDDEYGEFWSTLDHVLRGRNHPLRGLLQAAKSNNNSTIKHHWRTNKKLICVGSYESKTVDYLNKHRVNFEWQSKRFVLPNGKTYIPDLYLPDQDLWVEIKGYMRKDAQEKWDWFKSNFKAELWDKNKLKKLGIL